MPSRRPSPTAFGYAPSRPPNRQEFIYAPTVTPTCTFWVAALLAGPRGFMSLSLGSTHPAEIQQRSDMRHRTHPLAHPGSQVAHLAVPPCAEIHQHSHMHPSMHPLAHSGSSHFWQGAKEVKSNRTDMSLATHPPAHSGSQEAHLAASPCAEI